jgi:N-terminal C2 in EEIG1 and EHBP1 proteins
MLQGPEIQFEVIQEYYSGARGERIALGSLKLDLAEYVEGADGEGEEGISRRYLMRDSKINSTLKVCMAYLTHVLS